MKWYKDREFTSKLWRLATPIAIQSLMLAAVAAADAIMLGSIEQNAMSAVSLATQIQFVQNMILSSIASAFWILGAQYFGKGDEDSLHSIFCIAMRISAATSIVFFVGCVFFPRQLMALFTNEEVLADIGVRYLKIAGWSYLLTGVSQCFLTVLKVTEHTSMTAKISTATVLLNIVLNAVCIYGFAMQEQGAALATLIARVVELVCAVGVSFRSGYMRLKLQKLFVFHRDLSRDFMKCMLPLMGASVAWSVGFTSYTAFMGHLGTDAAASNSVASVVRDLVCCFCNGISSGAGIMIGNELGAGNLEKGKLYGDRFVTISFECGFFSTAVMLLLTPVLLLFVKLTEGAQSYLIGMMVIMAVYMIGRAFNTIIINGVFASGGDTAFDMYSLAVCMWMLAVPLAALGTFVFHWPVLVVYACTCLDEVGKIPWVVLHYKKYKWVKNLTRE